MMSLNIAICDDDMFALDSEAALVSEVLSEKQIRYSIDKFSTPQELLQSETMYHIVFLDIEMNDISGIKAAETIRKSNKNCMFFFVTNYEKYLDDAFNQHAFRFWTKPMDKRKLIYGIDSALREYNEENQAIEITANNTRVQVFISNIIYIFAQKKKTHIITTKGEIVTNDTYQSVFEQLKNLDIFFEPHRGCCVNFNYIRNYDKGKIYCIYRSEVYEVYLSRRRQEEFQRRFVKWIGDK